MPWELIILLMDIIILVLRILTNVSLRFYSQLDWRDLLPPRAYPISIVLEFKVIAAPKMTRTFR